MLLIWVCVHFYVNYILYYWTIEYISCFISKVVLTCMNKTSIQIHCSILFMKRFHPSIFNRDVGFFFRNEQNVYIFIIKRIVLFVIHNKLAKWTVVCFYGCMYACTLWICDINDPCDTNSSKQKQGLESK